MSIVNVFKYVLYTSNILKILKIQTIFLIAIVGKHAVSLICATILDLLTSMSGWSPVRLDSLTRSKNLRKCKKMLR